MVSAGADVVLTPSDGTEVARALATAAAAGDRVRVRGGGTKFDWALAPTEGNVILSTAGLTRVVDHRQGDLTVEVESGVPLATLNARLRSCGQWLPLESPFEAATVGGVLATNESGPLRHRYGSPRDLLIGTRLATTDGRIVRSGGNVVKNVAGYDLARLVTGSFGSLAVILSATFKLVPWPAGFATSEVVFSDVATATRAAAELAGSQLDPTILEIACEVAEPAPLTARLMVGFASTPDVVVTQMGEAERLLMRHAPHGCVRWGDHTDMSARWREHVRCPWQSDRSVFKISWLPATLDALFDIMVGAGGRGLRIGIVGRVALGHGVMWMEGDRDRQVAAVEEMSARRDVFKGVSVLRVDSILRARLPRVETNEPTRRIMTALKRAFDPAGVLSGRVPGQIDGV